MKVVILNGSPRAKGNTYEMCKAFSEGAQAAGHEVEYFHIGSMKIAPCLSCNYCKGEGAGTCIQKDDMPAVLEAIESSDLVVLASPVYYFSLSAQTQAMIDRFYCKGKPAIKKMLLMLSSGSQNAYSACISQYKAMHEYIGFEDMGMFTAAGDQNRSPELMNRLYSFALKLK